jgi:class 3 adenylate cyclase/uncharacterized protein (DUF427 family)
VFEWGILVDAYVINTFALPDKSEARIGTTVIASTTNASFMQETIVGSAIYFPKADTRTDLLIPSTTKTFCPFKGTANYWSIVLPNGDVIEDAGWSYERPLPEAEAIGGYVAFDTNKVTVTTERETPSDTPEKESDDNFTNWLMGAAFRSPAPEEFINILCEKLSEDGMPIRRMNVALWSLHPESVGRNYTWWREEDEINVFDLPMGALEHEGFKNSPTLYVSEGRGGVRQRLDDPEPEFDFQIMHDLREKGCTDYVAMPLIFSDGSIHVLSLTSDVAEGFSTAGLGQLFLHSGVISRILEVHVQRQTTNTLLETYLGPRSAARVLAGESHRGDGDTIEAAILYSDLRGSTQMAEQMSADDYLSTLNRFFDVAVEGIEKEGGEVLKFIGDAVLAIFPKEHDASMVSTRAVAASRNILDEIKNIDTATGDDMSCVVALHYGEVNYGNVGAQARLDYTAAGKAVNEVARLHELCKLEEQDCLLSDTIVAQLEGEHQPVGEHRLRGTGRLRTIYALAA